MISEWVVNSSPIITLAKIGRLDLLSVGERQILIPDSVVHEILNGPPNDPARNLLLKGWGTRRVPVIPDPLVIEWGLGMGETSVLSLAREMSLTAVVDDRGARRAASALGIRVVGTLGVVLRARLKGSIPSSVDVLRELKQAGLRLHDDIIRSALRETTGEIWPESSVGNDELP